MFFRFVGVRYKRNCSAINDFFIYAIAFSFLLKNIPRKDNNRWCFGYESKYFSFSWQKYFF